MSPNYKVYVHTFPNGKKYVGLTMQDVAKRWENGGGYKKCPKMWNALQKYGWNNVEHEVVAEGLTKEEAEALEIELIARYDSIRNGYNADRGGNTTGTHSDETRAKISEANKGKHSTPFTEERKAEYSEKFRGEKNPFFGRRHTEEVKTERRNAMMGNSFFKGKHHTEQFKKWKSEQMTAAYSGGRSPRCKKVMMVTKEGAETVFYSLSKAAETAGVSKAAMCGYIKNGTEVNGCRWEYV